jgi:hypothetical protein
MATARVAKRTCSSKEVEDYFIRKGIVYELTAHCTAEQNGLAEAKQNNIR